MRYIDIGDTRVAVISNDITLYMNLYCLYIEGHNIGDKIPAQVLMPAYFFVEGLARPPP